MKFYNYEMLQAVPSIVSKAQIQIDFRDLK